MKPGDAAAYAATGLRCDGCGEAAERAAVALGTARAGQAHEVVERAGYQQRRSKTVHCGTWRAREPGEEG